MPTKITHNLRADIDERIRCRDIGERQLAEISGVSHMTIYRFLRKGTWIREGKLSKILDALELELRAI